MERRRGIGEEVRGRGGEGMRPWVGGEKRGREVEKRRGGEE